MELAKYFVNFPRLGEPGGILLISCENADHSPEFDMSSTTVILIHTVNLCCRFADRLGKMVDEARPHTLHVLVQAWK